jgi:hypothetical protein
MAWTFANLVIQIGAGLVGANIAAAAAHKHDLAFGATALSAWLAAD